VNDASGTPRSAAGWYPHPPGSKEYGYWDGSAWRPDVMAAMNRMHNYSPPKSFRRWALARIGEFVPSDETVERIATGTSYFHRLGRGTSVVVTDRRLLLLIGSRHHTEARDYPFESISFVEADDEGLTVCADGQTLRIGDMNVTDADEAADVIQDRSHCRRTRRARDGEPHGWPYDQENVPSWGDADSRRRQFGEST
jgi:Bacterial PH domain